jgi:excisionase family DNA binding protein
MSASRSRAKRVEGSGGVAERESAHERSKSPHDASTDAVGLSADQLLTAQQLADRWQVPKQHVYRLTRRGEIPFIKLGRYVRYRLDWIEEWEREQANA